MELMVRFYGTRGHAAKAIGTFAAQLKLREAEGGL